MANGPFGNCKIAELHKTDKIQSYGCMLVIDRQTNTLIACSDNVERFLSLTSDNILGRHWDTVLQGIVLAQMREINRGQDLTMSRMSEAKINGKSCIIAHHSVNECCIVEIEWAKDTQELAASHEKAEFINKLKKATKARDCARILMDKVATLIDFDRVLFEAGLHP